MHILINTKKKNDQECIVAHVQRKSTWPGLDTLDMRSQYLPRNIDIWFFLASSSPLKGSDAELWFLTEGLYFHGYIALTLFFQKQTSIVKACFCSHHKSKVLRSLNASLPSTKKRHSLNMIQQWNKSFFVRFLPAENPLLGWESIALVNFILSSPNDHWTSEETHVLLAHSSCVVSSSCLNIFEQIWSAMDQAGDKVSKFRGE